MIRNAVRGVMERRGVGPLTSAVVQCRTGEEDVSVLVRATSGPAVDRRLQSDEARDLTTRSVAVAAALLAAALVVALVASGCAQSTGAGPASTGSPVADATDAGTPQPAVAEATWTGVYLLGGSSARECIVSNAGWAAAIARLGGRPPVRARDLGASYQTFARDTQLVAAMPEGPTLVLIGIGVGRFTAEPEAAVETPSAAARSAVASDAEVEHRYTLGKTYSDSEKQRLAQRWVRERYPLFDRNFAANMATLRSLVAFCRERGFTPVLLELPLDLATAERDLAPARDRYLAACRDLAADEDVRFVSFLEEVGIPSAYFYDLFHLVGPGREVWQDRLAREVVEISAAAEHGTPP